MSYPPATRIDDKDVPPGTLSVEEFKWFGKGTERERTIEEMLALDGWWPHPQSPGT